MGSKAVSSFISRSTKLALAAFHPTVLTAIAAAHGASVKVSPLRWNLRIYPIQECHESNPKFISMPTPIPALPSFGGWVVYRSTGAAEVAQPSRVSGPLRGSALSIHRAPHALLYRAAISAAYLVAITSRFIFMVGVSSPFSTWPRRRVSIEARGGAQSPERRRACDAAQPGRRTRPATRLQAAPPCNTMRVPALAAAKGTGVRAGRWLTENASSIMATGPIFSWAWKLPWARLHHSTRSRQMRRKATCEEGCKEHERAEQAGSSEGRTAPPMLTRC